MQHFSADGVDIAYLDEGPGPDNGPHLDQVQADPILLIHGFASNAHVNWVDTGWVRHLTGAGRRVVAMDCRGHGHSAKLHDPAAYGAPRLAEDACALLDHLAIPRADVMGYSMGARIAAFLALAHPDRVRSVVFAGLGGNMVRPMAGTGPVAAALEAPSIDAVTNAAARTFRAFAEQTRSDLKALAACIRSSRDPLRPEALATIACPVLVAVGTEDVIGGRAGDLAKLIPGAIGFDIEGRDHMKAVGDRSYKDRVAAFLAERP